MQNLSDKDQATLLSALLRMRLGKILLLFSAVLVFYEIIPENTFKGYEATIESYRETPAEEIVLYTPIVFDSVDIRNGIHVPTGMIADTGCAEVVQNCGACHSLELVKQNRATKEGWKDIITWMQETQKLWDLGLQEETILNYLAKNYGPQNSGRRKNLENIEWYQL
jgi:hypothetical protein